VIQEIESEDELFDILDSERGSLSAVLFTIDGCQCCDDILDKFRDASECDDIYVYYHFNVTGKSVSIRAFDLEFFPTMIRFRGSLIVDVSIDICIDSKLDRVISAIKMK
jgi:hypothetical protein